MTRTTEPTRRTASTWVKRLERGPEVGLAGAVRDEHEPGVGADAALLHRLDRHAVAAELPRDRRQHAGTVRGFHQEVEGRLQLGDRPDRLADERADRGAPGPGHEVLDRVDEVAENGRGGRVAARAAPVEHELADGVALDEHRVERVADGRQRVVHGHHRRVHTHRDLAVDLLGDREQLHHVAQRARRRDVVVGDGR